MQDLTDLDLHIRTGRAISRTSINQKRSGRSPIRAADLWPLADALAVDVDVLLLRPSDAAAWLAEHRPDELNREAPGKTERANTTDDQEGHRTITHRRRDSPCNHLVVPRRHARLGSRSHLPHPPLQHRR